MTGRILVAEDRPAHRAALDAALRAGFFDPAMVATMPELVARARAEVPDAFLLRGDLGGEACLDLCAKLRRMPATADVPILLTLPGSQAQSVPRALAAGADDALLRPVPDALLVARLRGLVRGKLQLDELRLRDALARDHADLSAPVGWSRGDPFAPPAGLLPGMAEAPSRWAGADDAEAVASAPYRFAVQADGANGRVALLAAPGDARGALRRALAAVLGPARLVARAAEAEAVLLDVRAVAPEMAARLAHRLRGDPATRHAVWMALLPPGCEALRAELLDRGAGDCLCAPATHDTALAEEVALRLGALLRRAAAAEALRRALAVGERLPVIDPLTGLFSRRYAEGYLARLATNPAGGRRPFGLLLVEPDRFEVVRDRLGDPAADMVLRAAANRLRGHLRGGDVLARMRGEEFLAILPDTDADTAARIAASLCHVMADAPLLQPGGAPVEVTLGIGIALSDPSAPATASDLLEAAAQALGAARAAGPNRSALAPRPAA
ncbi:MAG: diguanylate cyclase [Rhodobacteraceae bacterium]|nr:diguanylate cyclase [Paracoccaceae bacterium]